MQQDTRVQLMRPQRGKEKITVTLTDAANERDTWIDVDVIDVMLMLLILQLLLLLIRYYAYCHCHSYW
jgi:hypothetical protein